MSHILPYGYHIQNGIIRVNSLEAEVIKNIYRLYLGEMKIQHIANQLNIQEIPFRKDRRWNDKNIKKVLRTVYFGEGHFVKIINHDDWKKAQQKLDTNRDKYNSAKADIHDFRTKSRLNNKVFQQNQRFDLYHHQKSNEYVWSNPKQWYQQKNKQDVRFITNKQLEKSIRTTLKYLQKNTSLIQPKDSLKVREEQVTRINNEIGELYKTNKSDQEIIEAIGRKCEILYSYPKISDSEILTNKVKEYLSSDDLNQ